MLSLDATVLLLTPVVFATAAQVRARPRPHVYACMHLANTGSLLLPVSNLTNLLAFTASGLTFARFAGLMAAAWVVAIAVEYWSSACSSVATSPPAPSRRRRQRQPWPRFTVAVSG